MGNTLNWADLVKDAGESTGGFEPLPDGVYPLAVTEVKAGLTLDGMKTKFVVKSTVQEGAYKGRLLWDNLVISPENSIALGFFFGKMAALGIPREYFQRIPTPTNDEIEAVLQGRTFLATVKSKVYKGETRNEITRYSQPSADPVAMAAAAPLPTAAAPLPPVAAPPVMPAPLPPVVAAPVAAPAAPF